MLAHWGHLVARRPRTVLAVALLATVVTLLFGPGAVSRLSNGGWAAPHAESTLVPERLAATVGRSATDAIVLYTATPDGPAVSDPAFERAVTSSLAALPSDQVVSTVTYWGSGRAPALVSRDGRSTYALLQLAGTTSEARMDAFRAVEARLRDVGPGIDVRIGGEAGLNSEINHQVSTDLARAEQLSLPVLLVLLVLVFGSLVAAGLPLLVGIITVTGSLTVLRLLTAVTDVSVFAVNVITLLGLGLAIDYSLFLVSRFREELRGGREVPEALAVTMATAGRTVAFSAVTVAASLTGLMIFEQPFLKSMGYGGVAAVLVAMLTSLTLLPALLALLGARVDALRLRRPGRRRSAAAAPATPDALAVQGRGWQRFALGVMRRPVTLTLAVVVGLLVLAAPGLRAEFGGIDSRALPADSQGRAVEAQLAAQFPGTDAFPLQVLVDGGGAGAAAAVTAQLQGLDGVARVRPGGATAADDPRGVSLLLVDSAHGAMDDATLSLVREIRALPDPAGSAVSVGGVSAAQVDLRHGIAQRLPWMAGFMALATFVLLFGAFGSVVLPLKAIVTNLLSLAASFGVVVWIFGDGHLSGLLRFTPTGTIETTQPILMLAIVFGLSMDYEVFLLSRVREQWDATHDATDAVATGLARTGRIITSAALLLVVVIVAFSTSGIAFIKMLGVGMALAIALDSTVVRAVLVPATMRLLGPAAWWAPAPLARWQARYGFAERDEVVLPAGTASGAGQEAGQGPGQSAPADLAGTRG